MAQLCADCQTANHDSAKFCRGCGRRLASVETKPALLPARREEDWPATQRMSLDDDLIIPASRPAARSRSGAGAERYSSRRQSLPPMPPPPSRPAPPPVSSTPGVLPAPRSNTLRNMSIVLALILIAVVVAWAMSGNEGDGAATPVKLEPRAAADGAQPGTPTSAQPAASGSEVAPPAASAPASNAALPQLAATDNGTASAASAAAPATPAPAPVPVAAAAAAPELPPASATAPGAATPASAPAATPAPAPSTAPAEAAAAPAKPNAAQTSKTAPKAAATRKPRKPEPAPAVAAQPAPAAEPAPVAPPPPAATPQSLCADLNFFSRSRCLVSQCAKPEFQASSQCEPVHRQQQLEQEKRDPSLTR